MATRDLGDLFAGYLEDQPQAAYFSAAPFSGGYSPASRQYWSGQYGNITNQFWGDVGQQLRRGEFPSKTFTDFLQEYPWTERYTALGPRMRPGGSTQRYAPATRWAF